ncbi:MAG: FAD-dependent oxidoreductase [Puniceicoccaceae bacterium]
MPRRTFIKTAGLGAFATCSGSIYLSADEAKGDYIPEPERQIPVRGEYDVIVCGAGPAGVTAAIEAGRSGARTLLIESQGCLGGVWTSGLLCWILDGQNKVGIIREIYSELENRHAGFPNRGGNKAFAYDPEAMKLLLEELCAGAGVDLRLHTNVRAARVEKGQVTHAITESKSGREAWSAKIFVDCTGDGDFAALAGCGFEFGRPGDQAAQPMSLLALISGISYEEIEPFVRRGTENSGITKARLLEEIKRGGWNPSYQKPGIYPIHKDLFMLMANHEYGYKPFNTDELTKATLHARSELWHIVNSLVSLGGRWQNLRIVATGDHIGIREGRRIHGLYTVTQNDLVSGARFSDAVARVTFPVDVHSVNKEKDASATSYKQGVKSQPYDIPLRSLIAKDVNGLMMAGRCISGDFIAHSSYRVTGNAAAMGEAAGRVAAKAVKQDKLPQEVGI